jgi:hypothetical protein
MNKPPLQAAERNRAGPSARRTAVAQLRLLTDIVGFDLTHVYLMLHVLDKRSDGRDGERLSSQADNQSFLRMTLPECHVFLRALREFNGLIELTTPVLEEAKRARSRQNGTHAAAETREAAAAPSEPSLNEIMERLNSRITEGNGTPAEES